MNFSVGYSLVDRLSFMEAVGEWHEHIDEVYFSPPGLPSGRAPVADEQPGDQEPSPEMREDLACLAEHNMKLNLLFNANCYGKQAVSKAFREQIHSTVDRVEQIAGNLQSVTTTSPFVAETLRLRRPDINIRASVNMEIGTVEGMEYVSDLFDGFYLQRAYNRDFTRLDELSAWSDEHDKELHIIANSGCLNFCSNHTFHDNLVAHELEMRPVDKVENFNPVICRKYYTQEANRISLLRDSNWIRPEDLRSYEKYVTGTKLATRMHPRPDLVIGAYVRGAFPGNTLDLMEPGFSAVIRPWIMDNAAFPANWLENLAPCRNRSERTAFYGKLYNIVMANTARATG